MGNSLSPGEFRSGQLIDGKDGTPYQSCSLSHEDRVGPVLSIPYVRQVEQFSTTQEWFQTHPPASLIFHDNLGAVTLTGLRIRSMTGSTFVLGQLRSNVAVFGQPRELKPEYTFATLASRLDGLNDFASFSSVHSDIHDTDEGHRVVVTVEAREKITCQHNGFEFSIRATTPWTSTEGQSFRTEAGATLETTAAESATADDHITAQWPLRALLILAYGSKLYWRGHHIVDEQFPIWTIDGSSHGPDHCTVLLRRTVEDSEQPEPSRSDVSLPMFHLADLGDSGLRRWLELYQDPAFRRAVEPVVEVINGASRFLEPQVMMVVVGLDAMGYYRDQQRARNVPLFRQVERCLTAAGVDLSSIGPIRGVAKAIAAVNNDLKHPDRLSRPDPVHLSLVANLSIAVMRLQLFDLLGLPESARSRYASFGQVQDAVTGFEKSGLKVSSDGQFVSRVDETIAQ